MKKFIKNFLAIFIILSNISIWGASASVLNDKDIVIYKKIFTLQEAGKWKDADKYINRIDNKILLGHVQFQRYMHPTAYRAKYKELHMWLKKYNDHPGSKQLYELAKRRQPGGWKAPSKPKGLLVPSHLYITKPVKIVKKTFEFNKKEYNILNNIRKNVQRGNVTTANTYLTKNSKYLSRPAHAEAYGHIARGYYRYHKSQETLDIANLGYNMEAEFSWEANWWGGLSAFRDGEYTTAEKLFKRVGNSFRINDWLYSASWYWAGRSAYKAGNGTERSHWNKAGKKIRTFYGLVAIRSLGSTPALDFSVSSISSSDLQELKKIKGFKRAIALSQVGLFHRADRELKYIQPQIKQDYQFALMQAGVAFNTPYIQYKSGFYLENNFGENISEAYLYPNIPYEPSKRRIIDQALTSAFVRQESQFRAYAKSSAGARGLMQLMPYTARFVARKIGIRPNSFHGMRRNFLYRPELSMTLGQAYINILLNQSGYNKNLLYSIASYNAGPGNLQKWRNKIDYKNDPLLFIESLPSRETRLYMEKILSNFWIYRFKINGSAPSLDMIADGKWPLYKDMD